jgi:hypothetical protein
MMLFFIYFSFSYSTALDGFRVLPRFRSQVCLYIYSHVFLCLIFSWDHMWCDEIIYGLYFFLLSSCMYPLFHNVPFKIVLLWFYARSTAIVMLLEVLCLEFSKCSIQLFLNCDDVVQSPFLQYQLEFQKTRSHSTKYEKYRGYRTAVMAVLVIIYI